LCRPLFRAQIGKFGTTIEIKFVNIVATFFDEKNLVIRTGPPEESISTFESFESVVVRGLRGVRIILFVMEKRFLIERGEGIFLRLV